MYECTICVVVRFALLFMYAALLPYPLLDQINDLTYIYLLVNSGTAQRSRKTSNSNTLSVYEWHSYRAA